MVSLNEAFTLFLYFYAVFTPIMTLLMFSYIKSLEKDIQTLREELFYVKRKINGFKD
jgi:RsiW-degrading membrane proteinase PrsW (M82 family)